METNNNKPKIIKFKDLGEQFLWIHEVNEVDSLNKAYGKKFNYYFVNPFTIETYGSMSVFPESVLVKVGK